MTQNDALTFGLGDLGLPETHYRQIGGIHSGVIGFAVKPGVCSRDFSSFERPLTLQTNNGMIPA